MSKTTQRKIFRKYPLCGPKGNLFFLIYNLFAYFYQFLFKKKQPKLLLREDLKILLCCEAALGDVLLASSVISPLKKKFPLSQIGFLCKEESYSVLENEKRLSFTHRSKGKNKKKLIEEIKEVKYDLSFELHPFFDCSIPLVRKAGVPIQIGFDSGGYDVWLQNPVPFPEKLTYLPDLYSELLKQVGVVVLKPRPELFLNTPNQVFPKEYIVLHLGTSNPLKEWEIEKWKELACYLRGKGHFLVFTGKGKREQILIEKVAICPEENFCNKLSWNDFAFVIKGSKALISVDSVSVHLGALFNIPTIGIYLYSHCVDLWIPAAQNSTYLIGKECVYFSKNISQALCLEEISVFNVINNLKLQ